MPPENTNLCLKAPLRTVHVILLFNVYLVVATYMAFINLRAPFYRDGSMFLFMANNIRFGQPPYWACWDTKNPFVEYFWAYFHNLVLPFSDIVTSTRIAEGTVVALTGTVAALMVTAPCLTVAGNEEHGQARRIHLLGFVAGLFVIYILSDHRATDCGLYISLYQALPEAVVLLVAARLLHGRSIRRAQGFRAALLAILLGVSVFTAWGTKQTSLISLTPPLLVTVAWAAKTKRLGPYLKDAFVGFCVFAGLVGAFILNLARNGTLATYWKGAYGYNLQKLSSHMPTALGVLRDYFSRWEFPENTVLWTTLAFVAGTAAFSLEVTRVWIRRERMVLPYPKLLSLAWLAGGLVQSYSPMTLFHHYFFASWTPAAILAGLYLGSSKVVQRGLYLINAAALVSLVYVMVWYSGQKDVLEQMRQDKLLFRNIPVVSYFAPPSSRVFTWGGFAHYNVLNNKKSDYPRNMWWFHITGGVSPEQRDETLREIFKDAPPDHFIETYETYVPERRFTPVRLDAGLLKKWTGCDYGLSLNIPESPGRLGRSIRVFDKGRVTKSDSAEDKTAGAAADPTGSTAQKRDAGR